MSTRLYGYGKRKRYGYGSYKGKYYQRYQAKKNNYYERHNYAKGIVPKATRGWDWKHCEKKFLDTTIDGLFSQTPSATGLPLPSLFLCNGIIQGTDWNMRIGREIIMTSVQIRMQAIQDVNSPVSQNIRLMMVYDKQPNSVQVLSSDILQSTGSIVGTTVYNNLNNRDRFVTLYDKVIQLQMNGGLTNAGPTCDVAYRYKYKKCMLPVVYSNTGSGIGSLQTGALWLVLVADYAQPANIPADPDYRPSAKGTIRIRYKDC